MAVSCFTESHFKNILNIGTCFFSLHLLRFTIMQFQKAYNYLIQRLEHDLADHLTYHNASHTKYVVEFTKHLAKQEGINGQEYTLLCTAALFHDAGFLEGYENHEELSCKIAKEQLPKFHYTDQQIERICQLIMATKMPQNPTNKEEEIMCDADLYYIGTELFFKTASNLYKEFKVVGLINNWEEWQELQIRFLENHQFFTETANQECAENKLRNLQLLNLKKKKKNTKAFSNTWINSLHDYFLIVVGVVMAGFALKGFLVPNHFFDGGITGLSLLVHELYHFNLSVLILVLNLPLIIVSYYSVGRNFAYKTFMSVLLLGICLQYLPYPLITSDKLLISIFGGFFLGVGIGLIMRSGSALDGIEVLALYTLKRTSFTITEIILAMNVLIFGIAAIKFGLETSLYSILVYFTATRTIDYVVEGIEAYTGVTIISGRSEIIKQKLVNELGRGITVYKGERGFLPGKYDVSSECDIIFTIVSRLELRRLKNLVHDADPKAFVFANTIKEASGGIIKQRHAH